MSPIRLVSGDTGLEGRVEVYYDREWCAVCGNGWNLNDATVVCRELGFGPAIVGESEELYGQVNKKYWCSDLNCAGTESNFVNCPHSKMGVHDCNCSSDAIVKCTAPNGNVCFINSCIYK